MKVEVEKDVIEFFVMYSELILLGVVKKKLLGNGLLWFVVIIFFFIVFGMVGVGYWYYM